MNSSQPNLSLLNGLFCLQTLFSAGKPLGSRELARLLSMDHAKINRLLKTLASEQFVIQDKNRKYLPGPAVHVLAAQSLRGSGLLAKATPFLKDLLKLKLNVALGTLWKDQVCYLFHGRHSKPFEAGIAGHSLFPAKESSIGQVLQAFQAEQGYAVTTPREGAYSLAVPIGQPPIAGLALSGEIAKKQIPEFIETLRKTAQSIEGALL
jgi:DNA-binding IclR family transcriptional regulator